MKLIGEAHLQSWPHGFHGTWWPSALSNPPHLDPLPSGRGDPSRYVIAFASGSTSDKFLCVVVKVAGDDAFVLTAYLTDKVKKGVQLWPRGG